MNARQRFKIGDRVVPTAELQAGHKKVTIGPGRVVGFGRGEEIVAVVRDGRKSREAFHESFWIHEAARDEAVDGN